VVPGDTLEMSVELGRMSARAGKGTGRASVGGELACQCELLFVLVDP
jgi:3-hydroxyacyl-[acyl-carrier-protein] dehydratase